MGELQIAAVAVVPFHTNEDSGLGEALRQEKSEPMRLRLGGGAPETEELSQCTRHCALERWLILFRWTDDRVRG